MTSHVIGIDHIYISVSDLGRSEAFYDIVMPILGFRKSSKPIDGDPHIHYYGAHFGFSLRPARTLAHRDPYSPGLHHFCFRVNTTEDLAYVHAA